MDLRSIFSLTILGVSVALLIRLLLPAPLLLFGSFNRIDLILCPALRLLRHVIRPVKRLNCHTSLLAIVFSIADEALRRPPDLAGDDFQSYLVSEGIAVRQGYHQYLRY